MFSSINLLKQISTNKDDCLVFNNNFNAARLVSVEGVSKMKQIGPIHVDKLKDLFDEHGQKLNKLQFCVHTTLVVHFVFDNFTMLSALKVGDTITYLTSTTDKTTWVRLQNFFYNHTSRSVSHAKKAPPTENGNMTLEQILRKYSTRRTLT